MAQVRVKCLIRPWQLTLKCPRGTQGFTVGSGGSVKTNFFDIIGSMESNTKMGYFYASN